MSPVGFEPAVSAIKNFRPMPLSARPSGLADQILMYHDRGSRVLWDVTKIVPYHTAQHPCIIQVYPMYEVHRVTEEKNILLTIKQRKAKWIRHILRKKLLQKRIIQGMMEGTKRQKRRHKQLLDNVKETRRYWKQKQEALDRTPWRIHLEVGKDL